MIIGCGGYAIGYFIHMNIHLLTSYILFENVVLSFSSFCPALSSSTRFCSPKTKSLPQLLPANQLPGNIGIRKKLSHSTILSLFNDFQRFHCIMVLSHSLFISLFSLFIYLSMYISMYISHSISFSQHKLKNWKYLETEYSTKTKLFSDYFVRPLVRMFVRYES